MTSRFPHPNRSRLATFLPVLLCLVAGLTAADTPPAGEEVTIIGGLMSNAITIPNPKPEDYLWVCFAVDGSPSIQAQVKTIMDANYPEKGLNADEAVKLQDLWIEHLKFYIDPESPAAPAEKLGPKHYDHSAAPSKITGTLYDKDGKHWIRATKIEAARIKYPEKFTVPDKALVPVDPQKLTLKINDTLSMDLIKVPAGKFLAGAPFYWGFRYQEEYPHLITLTKSIYLGETPVTQEVYEAVMGENPSVLKGPKIPVQNPKFMDMEKFCQRLSEKTGRKVRLPTCAEWEYCAKSGTSNPPFPSRYDEQNSDGGQGWKAVLPVKSKKPNAWGFYDMASKWWEITSDSARYPARQPETDPSFPPSAREKANADSKRVGMGIPKDNWSMAMREFENETGLGYCFNKFRIVVEDEPGK